MASVQGNGTQVSTRYTGLVESNPRNDRPIQVGSCIWTINSGEWRFQHGARSNTLNDMGTVDKIRLLASVNERLEKVSPVFANAGVLVDGGVHGLRGIEMHYPNEINNDCFRFSQCDVMNIVAELKANGLVASMVTPNLFYTFMERAFTSNNPKERARAIEYTKRTIDVAYILGNELGHLPTLVFWPGGEGVNGAGQVDYVRALHQYADALNQVMQYEQYCLHVSSGSSGIDYPGILKRISGADALASPIAGLRYAGEAKPDEPMDVIFLPTTADVLVLRGMLDRPKGWGANPETAHEMLANISPVIPVAAALAQDALFHYHWNWQNGPKWDQDLGVVVNTTMLEIVHMMKEYGFGSRGEFTGLDIQARSNSRDVLDVVELSVQNLRILEAVEKRVDWELAYSLANEGRPEQAHAYLERMIQGCMSGIDPTALINLGKRE